jgi:multiple sugar transport system permease protein/putative chitobiose transport system permease protein
MRPRLATRTATTVVRGVVALGIFIPIWWLMVASLSPGNTFVRDLNPLSWGALVPTRPSLVNYLKIWESGYGWALGNSLLVAAATIVVGIALSVLAGYAFAFLRFPLRSVLFAVMIVVSMMPFDVLAIPLAGELGRIGLSDTYVGLILPGVANGFAVFLMRQAFLDLPYELVEAARIDGLGEVRILWSVILPNSRGALLGAGMMLFIGQWHAYLWPLLIGTSQDKQLAQIFVANMRGMFNIDLGGILAGSVLLALIPLVLLMVFRNSFARSLSATGLKG